MIIKILPQNHFSHAIRHNICYTSRKPRLITIVSAILYVQYMKNVRSNKLDLFNNEGIQRYVRNVVFLADKIYFSFSQSTNYSIPAELSTRQREFNLLAIRNRAMCY